MNLLDTLFHEPLIFFAIVFVFLITLSIHEFSHALAAFLLGDLTAKRAHRLTLNPMAHIDWLGFLLLVSAGFGWGKPVPFNPYNLKYPRWGPVIVAGAGPLSNFVMGGFFALLYRLLAPSLGPSNLLMFILHYGSHLSFLLGFFNLIPIPPLDGSKALLVVLANERYRDFRYRLEAQGPFILLILLIVDRFVGIGIFSWLITLASGAFRLIVE